MIVVSLHCDPGSLPDSGEFVLIHADRGRSWAVPCLEEVVCSSPEFALELGQILAENTGSELKIIGDMCQKCGAYADWYRDAQNSTFHCRKCYPLNR